MTPENDENGTNERVSYDASMRDASNGAVALDVPSLHVLQKSSII